MTSKNETRFARILRMVPFLSSHQGIEISEACEIFGVSERELIADLNLLWVCGLPGYSHLELIDVQFDRGYISIANAGAIAKPRRLTYEESSALIVALNSLLLSVDTDAKENILNLINKLVKISERADPKVSIDISKLSIQPDLLVIDKAITANLQISIDYYSPTSDQLTTRDVAPLEYLADSSGGRYLYAWCYSANDYRQFKIERIRGIRATHTKVTKFAQLSKLSRNPDNFIELELNEKALWFAEEWGIRNMIRNQSDEGFIGTVNLHNHEWAIRAVLALSGEMRIPSDTVLRKEVAARAAASLANYAS
ncbi:MAG: WYL domain-containing protein [Candidatus Nanopelagicaceae bacterium]|nr:WYL domain-containing protein [Candidatus Nanopelagicaceae bacterium]